MDVDKHDNDSDLSFEALTFGDNHHNDAHDKNGAQYLPKKNKDKFRKKINKKEGPHTPEGEREKNSSVYISTQDDKIDVQAVLRKLEHYGTVRGYYFKEKQNFGIVQFVDPSVVDAVIENFNSDDLGFHVTVERTARAKDHSASPHSFGSIPASVPSLTPSTPPPEKPDTILVLKNLPFTLKQDQLHEILLSLSTTIPQSISLHYDNAGVFRGMAFIKYRQLDDAIQVYELLNGMDVGGRKVRVEYKRKAANATTPRGTPDKPIEIPTEWQEDEELRKLWEQLLHFKEDQTQNEWHYPSTLTNNQKRNIYNMCEKLRLYQGTVSTDSEVRVQYLTKKPASSPHSDHHVGSVDSKRGVDIKARRPRHDSDAGARNNAGSPRERESDRDLRSGRNSSVGRNNDTNKHASTVASSAPADIHHDWRQTVPQAQNNQASLVAPVRQPRGPDGSKGFGDQYRTARKLNLHTTCAFLAVPSTPEVAV